MGTNDVRRRHTDLPVFPSACPTALHEAIKADDERWRNETTPVGIQDSGDEVPLELKNCCHCTDTLARPVRR